MAVRSTLLAALLCLSAGPALATNGFKLTAYGPRAAGRGGVDYAFADDGIGPVNNPAGMAFVYGNRLDSNWAVVKLDVEWENVFGRFEKESDLFFPLPAFSFGAVFSGGPSTWDIAPLFDLGRWGLLDDRADRAEGPPEEGGSDEALDAFAGDDEERLYGGRWRFGFGVFPVTGGVVKIKDLDVSVDPNNPASASPADSAYLPPLDWETNVLALAVTPSLAYRFNRYFSVGLSLQFIYSRFEIDGGIAQPLAILRDDFEFPAVALNFSNSGQMLTAADVDDAWAFGFSGRLGILFNSEYFSAGLVYQEKSHMADFLGRSTVDATDEVNRMTATLGGPAALALIDPGINPALGFTSVYDLRIEDFEAPRMVGLGFAVRPHRRLSLGFDYTYIHWSEVARVLKVRLSHGDNQNLDIMTGGTVHVRIPLQWENQHVIAFGVTWLAYEGDDLVEGVPSWALVLRAGYNYGKSPTPDDTTLPQQPTISEHHVSGGFTLHWGPLIEFNVAVEYALPRTLKTPSNRFHTADYTLSGSKQTASILFVSFGLGVNF